MKLAQVGERKRDEAEFDVTTSDASVKRRKINGCENRESKFASPLYAQTSRRITPENCDSLDDSRNQQDRISSPSSDEHVSASCCLSNDSSEQAKDNSKVTDLEDENNRDEPSAQLDCTESKETTNNHIPFSDEMELTTCKQPEAKACKRSTTAGKIPSDAEIEEFFAAAEKVNLEKFNKKYNFDFMKEAPVEGRYEWVQLNP